MSALDYLNISGAIEQIYAAAAEPDLWPAALQAIATCFGDIGANLIYTREDGSAATIVSPSLEAAQRDYANGWWEQDLRRRIAMLIPRLSSDFDGEIVATVKAIGRTLAAGNQDWHGLADIIRGSANTGLVPPSKHTAPPTKRTTPSAPPTSDWRRVLQHCELYGIGCLNARDAAFIDTLARTKPTRLSQRQQEWLGDIAGRLGMRGAA